MSVKGRGISCRGLEGVRDRVGILIDLVRVDLGTNVDSTCEATAIGIDQKLVFVKEQTGIGIPRALGTKTVVGSKAETFDIPMPDAVIGAKKTITLFKPGIRVNDAEVNLGSTCRYHCNVET